MKEDSGKAPITVQSESIPTTQVPDTFSLGRPGAFRFEGIAPLPLLAVIISGIFLAEVIAMLVVDALGAMPYFLTTLVDAGIMVALIFPILYYLSYRPLLLHIDRRRGVERKLQLERDRMRTILDTIPDGIYILNQNYDMEYVNPVIEKTFGPYQGFKCYAYLHGRSDPCPWCKNDEVFRGKSAQWECRFEKPDRIYELFDTPLVNSDGTLSKLELFHDITDRKQTEEVLELRVQQRTEELAKANFLLQAEIAERKQAELALRASEQKYSVLFDKSPFALALTSMPAGVLVDVNDAFLDLFEFSRNEVIGQTSIDLGIADADLRALVAAEFASKGSVHDFECRRQTRTGTQLVLSLDMDSVSLGGEEHVLTTVRDISQRVRAEETLRYQAALLTSVNDAVIASDADYHITVWNSAAESLYGWKADEVLGRSGVEIMRTEWPGQDPAEMRRVIAETGRWRGEATQVRKEGGRFPVEASSIVLRDDNGEITGYISVNRDITERKHMEAALRAMRDELELRVEERTKELAAANLVLVKEISERKEVERQLRVQTTALESAANGIIITGRDGDILWANPAFLAMSGYSMEEVLGKNPRLLKSGQHDTDFYRDLWETILAGRVWRGEFIDRRKDGSFYVEEQTITPLLNEDGQVSHFIAIKQDITERKQAELELRYRNDELQAVTASEQKQRRITESLLVAAQALTQTLDLDAVLKILLKQMQDLVHADAAGVIFLEDEALLKVRAAEGSETWNSLDQVLSIRVDAKTSPLYRKLAGTRKGILIPDTSQEPDWQEYPGTESLHNWILVPILVEGKMIGLVALGKTEAGFFTAENVQWAEALAGEAAIAIQNAWLFQQLRAGRERLQSLSRGLVEIQETERRFVSRELHDHAGQGLTSLIIGLGALEREANRPSRVRARCAELKAMTNDVMEDIHRLAINLRPVSLDHLGLLAALEQLGRTIAHDSNLVTRIKAVGISDGERLSQDVETAFYRIAQEAFNNILRHANAGRIDVVLERRDDTLVILIEDDGRGFDLQVTPEPGHLGLLGIQERAETLGGKMSLESAPGKGTTLIVEVPYGNPDLDRR